MMIAYGVSRLQTGQRGSVVCIGTFDGVHLGHQTVIREAASSARSAELPCGLVTFDRHPAATLAPTKVPKALSPPTQNLELLKELGVDFVLVLAFDVAFSQTSATEFFEETLVGLLRAKKMVVGHDFAFGHRREGTPEWLAGRIETTIVPAFEFAGERVSSSRIRAAIEAGDIPTANAMLGRRFGLSGFVVSGDKLGRTLGFPTANLAPFLEGVTPPDGVYAGEVETPFGVYAAAISLGTRPSVGGSGWVCEAHLLDYPGESLYGRAITLRLGRRIRKQERFDSVEELREWIARDVNQIRTGGP